MEEYLLNINEGKTVWVLVIEHRYGFNHYVNRSKEGMLDTLAGFAREWWDELSESTEMPLDRQDIINTYFDDHDSEWYTYEEVIVKY